MELRRYFSIVWKWWWLIVASALIAGVAAFFVSRSVPRTYASHVTLIVGQVLDNPSPTQSDISAGVALAQSYADLVRRQPVLQGTLDALKLDWSVIALQQAISSRVVPGTQLLEITVNDTDPNRAQAIANEIGQQAIQIGPSDQDPLQADQRQFIIDQMNDLKGSIQQGLTQNRQLDATLAQTTDATRAQALRDQQTVLRTQITAWQNTYAQLLTGLRRNVTNFLSVVEPAQASNVPVAPKPLETTVIAALIGLLLSVSGAFLIEYLDDTIKTPEDARQVFNLPVLGTVGQIESGEYPDKLITVTQPRSPLAESFRILRANLQFSAVDQALGVLMISSTSPAEGKSLTAANLAVVMAQSGKRVVLIDADLRRPTQHRIFQLKNGLGLTNVLLDGLARLTEALQSTKIENLRILTAGAIPPNPSEMLGSARMAEFLQALRAQADLIIIDTPPVLVVSDATLLSPRVDGVLIVINSAHTRRPIAQRAEVALKTAGARVLGVSLNRLAARDAGYHYDYYYAEQGNIKRPRRWFGRNSDRREPVPAAPTEQVAQAVDKA